MPKKKPLPAPPVRKPRADAQRNRERILEVAKGVFTRDGAAASLDEIARQAGIGPGTLYRHFPTRDTLIEAVYRNEVAKLAAAEQRFAATMPPLEALRAWMLLFIDHVAGKMLIIPAMNTVAGGSMRLIEGSRSLIHTAFATSVKRAIASGDLRSGHEPGRLRARHGWHFPHHGVSRMGGQCAPPRRHSYRRVARNAQANCYPTPLAEKITMPARR